MKEITCIVCPNGCRLTVDQTNGEVRVTGAACKRGVQFAVAECTHPMRSPTIFDDMPRLPVRTRGEIPKDKLFEAMERINRVRLTRRVRSGEVVLADVFGADIIATSDL